MWLKAYRAVGSFRGESSFYTWLRQITIKTFLKHKQEKTLMFGSKTAPVKMEELDAADDLGRSPVEQGYKIEADIHKRLLIDKVMRALAALTPQQGR